MNSFRFRWIALLLLSYATAGAINVYAPITLLTITVISYVGALLLSKNRNKSLFILFLLFTSTPLFATRLTALHTDLNLSLLASVGLSFYTLKALSYIIEIYRSKLKTEKHFGLYALYLGFFPQLFAGPIDRPQTLLSQFRKPASFSIERTYEGLVRILWGLFQKIVIADRFAVIVDSIYLQPKSYTGIPLILAMLLFSVQIYCDFAGYSNISIGIARMLGIKSTENFDKPYSSKSIKEFWTRWHISLSSWLRDYVYIPLGGSRVNFKRQSANVLITFVASGLWHGAGITFVVWGLLHGLAIILSSAINLLGKEFKKDRDWQIIWNLLTRLYSYLAIPFTFGLITILWVFFRASSLSDAIYIVTHFYRGLRATIQFALELHFEDLRYLIFPAIYGGSENIYVTSILSLLLFAQLSAFTKNLNKSFLRDKSIFKRWVFYYIVFGSILFTLFFYQGQTVKFIYSRF